MSRPYKDSPRYAKNAFIEPDNLRSQHYTTSTDRHIQSDADFFFGNVGTDFFVLLISV